MSKKNTQTFINYFDQQFWGNRDGSSGPNSAYELTPKLRANLQCLFQELKLQSILDIGCGDANLFRHMDISTIAYTGLECVPALTEQNQQNFADKLNMRFATADGITDDLPQADLILCRDVVHYLPNELVLKLLDNIARSNSQYLLITHNVFSPHSANTKTEIGVFRPVNLCQAPFNWPEPLQVIEEDEYEWGKALGLWQL